MIKTEQEQIEEMAYRICGARDVGIIKNCATCKYKNSCEKIIYARIFYHKGYRKASDVIDEFVERLNKDWLEVQTKEYGRFYAISEERIHELADEMRQEVK